MFINKKFRNLMKLVAGLLLVIFPINTIAAVAVENVTFYVSDVQGTTVSAFNESGVPVWNETYHEYGERASNTGDNSLGYTGHIDDSDTGFIYTGARWYDAKLGRFLAPDTGQLDPYNYLTYGRYIYANNNPNLYVDPDGNTAIPAGLLLLSIAAIYIGSTYYGGQLNNYSSGNNVYNEATDASSGSDEVGGSSGSDADVTKRPGSFRKKTVKDDWDNAADGTKPDTKTCPTCGKDVSGNPHKGERRDGADGWDVDHQPKWNDRDLSGLDRKQVLDEYNKDTQLRCPHCNRADNQ